MIAPLISHASAVTLLIAAVAWTIYLRAEPVEPADPLADLTERLQHPVRWTLRNPVRAAQRVRIFGGPDDDRTR